MSKLDDILADFSVARDYPPLMYEESKNEAKEQIKKTFLRLRDVVYLRTNPDVNEMMAEFDKLVNEL